MTETVGEIRRKKNLALPDLIAIESLTNELSLNVINRQPTHTHEIQPHESLNQSSKSKPDDKSDHQNSEIIKISSQHEHQKNPPPPLQLNDQEFLPINHVLPNQFSASKMLLTPNSDQAANDKKFDYSNRQSRDLTEMLSPEISPRKKDNLHVDTMKCAKDDTLRDNVNLSVEYDDAKTTNSKAVSLYNSQIVAVQDYENLLKEVESPCPRKSRFNNLMTSSNPPSGKINDNLEDESTIAFDSKDSRKQSVLSSNDKVRRSSKRNWNNLSILVKSIILLKNEEVKNIGNLDDINEEMTGYKSRSKPPQINPGKYIIEKEDFISDALQEIRYVHIFCESASIGSDNSLACMQELMAKDPKRNLLERSDPAHFINKKNRFNQNALYLAAKNGNMKIVKYLIQQHSNPHVESSPDGKGTILEKPLHVAARWGHLEVINFLIENGTYSKEDLEKAYKMTEKPHIKEALSKYYSSKHKSRIRKLLCGCL